jgi:multidrug efflux pump subunit AcrB
MGKISFTASMDGTKEISLAGTGHDAIHVGGVFLPIGFMGGIISQVLSRNWHHHRFSRS